MKSGRILFLAYAGGLAALAAYSFLTVPVLKTGRYEWIIGNTLTLFIRGFIPLHMAALLFGHSVYFTAGELFREAERQEVFLRIVKSSSILFLILAALYTGLLEGVLPAGIRLRDEAVRKNAAAEELLVRARGALEEKRFRDAQTYLDHYGTIVPDDPDVKKDRETAKAGAAAEEVPEKPAVNPETAVLPLREMSFQDFLARAEERFAGEDYISAEHYAAMAHKMDDRHPAPKRIMAESRDRISRTRLSRQARENIEFFRGKRIGYDLLNGGDYIGAFYHLQDLLKAQPDDPDVLRYLEAAYRGTRKISFFLDEVPGAPIPLEEGRDVLFLNRSDENSREFLHIRSIVPSYAGDTRYRKPELETVGRDRDGGNGIFSRIARFFRSSDPSAPAGEPTGYYALGIEGIRISRDGDKIFHFKAPYGKFIENTLVMHCLDRGRRDKPLLPVYLAGEAPDQAPSVIRVTAAPEELDRLSAGISGFHGFNVWELGALAKTFARLGWDPEPAHRAFLDRLFLPFSFLTLSFAAAAFGLRLRSRYLAGPPAGTFLFLPVLPFLTAFVFEVYRYACSALPSAVLSVHGFAPALAVFLVMQGFLLLFALILTARQVRG